MNITVFTSNQPRHLALIEALASVADTVHAVQECVTVFPGQIEDFYKKTEVMQTYFGHVQRAEKTVFGGARLLPSNVRQLCLKMGDLSKLGMDLEQPLLQADRFVVFGASYIRGPLCDYLVEKGALNIHMGVSPYYRGSSCNFWALFDRRPGYVGATIHLLSKGLDSGKMFFHALPRAQEVDGFELGMRSVKAAHMGLSWFFQEKNTKDFGPVVQDKSKELRYTRNADFTDEKALAYLGVQPSPQDVLASLKKRDEDLSPFLRPYIY